MSIADDGPPFGVAERLDDLLLRLDGWRARPLVVLAAAAALIGLVATMWWFGRPAEPVPFDDLIPMAEPDAAAVSQPPSATTSSSLAAEGSQPSIEDGEVAPDLVVHVVGAVRVPGLVTVEPGSRVGDVIIAAGGAVDGADTQRLNLAAPVSDGMQVRVPLLDADPDEELIVVAPRPTSATPDESRQPPGPIDLNRADAGQLESLPGVGPAIAAAIIAWREENGGFSEPEDLLQVPGIGPAKMGAIRDRVTTDR